MILENTIGYSYNDITIIPNVTSKVQSRKLVDPFDNTYVPTKKCPNKKMLPIFTAPMSCVLDDVNYELFEANHIYTVIPTTVVNAQRHVMFFAGGRFVSFSLDEAHDLILNEVYKKGFLKNHTYKLCIDCANGHMDRLLFICDRIKEFAKERGCEIEIMTGNIANPNTWLEYNKHKIDYVRVGIGGGSGCFIDGTKITTKENGKKNIENIKIGEEVLTHDGNFYRVTDKIRYKTSNALLCINNEITCTQNHKFLVINKEDKNKVTERNLSEFSYWIEAKNLDKNTHLLVKRIK